MKKEMRRTADGVWVPLIDVGAYAISSALKKESNTPKFFDMSQVKIEPRILKGVNGTKDMILSYDLVKNNI